jgi:hypothetical protein
MLRQCCSVLSMRSAFLRFDGVACPIRCISSLVLAPDEAANRSKSSHISQKQADAVELPVDLARQHGGTLPGGPHRSPLRDLIPRS